MLLLLLLRPKSLETNFIFTFRGRGERGGEGLGRNTSNFTYGIKQTNAGRRV